MKTYKRDSIGRFASLDCVTRSDRMQEGTAFEAVCGAAVVTACVVAFIALLPFIGQVVILWHV